MRRAFLSRRGFVKRSFLRSPGNCRIEPLVGNILSLTAISDTICTHRLKLSSAGFRCFAIASKIEVDPNDWTTLGPC